MAVTVVVLVLTLVDEVAEELDTLAVLVMLSVVVVDVIVNVTLSIVGMLKLSTVTV